MGGAVAAAGRDPTLTWLNPAAAAGNKQATVTFSGQKGFIGDTTWLALGVLPIHDGGGLVTGVAWYDAGSVVLHPAGGEQRTVDAQLDGMGLLGAAGEAGGVRAGVNAKFLRSTLFNERSASAGAFDAGLCAEPLEGWTAGVLAQNMSGGIRFEKTDVPLPTVLRAGLAAQWSEEGNRLIVSADGVRDMERKKYGWGGGVEFRFSGTLSLRGGVGRKPELNGIGYTFGMGFEGFKYRIDYGVRLEPSETSPQVFSFTVIF